jgi:AGZA family xanthine/uracil permease-like MFS transporter
MKPGAQITQSPAHNTMSSRNGALFNPLRQSLHDKRCDAAGSTPTMTINQTRRSLLIKAQNPVPNNLSVRSRKTGRFISRRPVINRRKGQKPPGLGRVSASSGKTAHSPCVIVITKCNSLPHLGYLPSSMVSGESHFYTFAYPNESQSRQIGISGLTDLKDMKGVDQTVPLLMVLVTVMTGDYMISLALGLLLYTLIAFVSRRWSEITMMLIGLDVVFVTYLVLSSGLG